MSRKWRGGKGKVQVRDLTHKGWWAIVYPTGEWFVYAYTGHSRAFQSNKEIAKGTAKDMDAAKEAVAKFERTRK